MSNDQLQQFPKGTVLHKKSEPEKTITQELYEALKEISEGKGRYSQNRLEHASNTIEDMKALANEAILKYESINSNQ